MDPRAAGRSFACRPRRRLHGRALLLGDPRVPSSLSIECKLCKCTDGFAHQLGSAKAPCELCDRLPVGAHRRARALSGRASSTKRVQMIPYLQRTDASVSSTDGLFKSTAEPLQRSSPPGSNPLPSLSTAALHQVSACDQALRLTAVLSVTLRAGQSSQCAPSASPSAFNPHLT